MRRWLLLILVLLLPLRGLVGEAMAGEMLAQAMQQAHAPQHEHATAHDCEHHDAQHTHEAQASAGTHGDCPTCAACQVCSSAAVIPSAAAPSSNRLSQAPPPAVLLAFHSAEPTHAFKPPKG
jgi:hypothetical protein